MFFKKGRILMVGFLFLSVPLMMAGCVSRGGHLPVDRNSVAPGTLVTRGEDRYKLIGTPLEIGKPLPSVTLVDAVTMREVDLSRELGSVLLLSTVVSVDTPVCEEQTHYLGEKGKNLPEGVKRITISRDLPFAQKRFTKEAKLTNIEFLSDYRSGDFGKATGLMLDHLSVLARSVILVDKKGIVRYIQVVPDITHLPNMDLAFQEAIMLSKEP